MRLPSGKLCWYGATITDTKHLTWDGTYKIKYDGVKKPKNIAAKNVRRKKVYHIQANNIQTLRGQRSNRGDNPKPIPMFTYGTKACLCVGKGKHIDDGETCTLNLCGGTGSVKIDQNEMKEILHPERNAVDLIKWQLDHHLWESDDVKEAENLIMYYYSQSWKLRESIRKKIDHVNHAMKWKCEYAHERSELEDWGNFFTPVEDLDKFCVEELA